MLPPTYLGLPDVIVWSLYLNGTDVNVNPYLAVSLAQDVTARVVLINVKATARLRTKNGAKVRYRMKVNCPAYVTFGNQTDGNIVGSTVKPPFVEGCYTQVKL
ncbi:hypothetical protein L1987_56486 [Smallanthus sonchifolius]|uniref:Uncharacterized protein n=1 Tax=Smallanthus sonchifolius TaxID=185202 RepID=A0ACB9ECK2_9ASTR|nr:hypothetical protein L1987_56486 [Smallanthus sonchifolius]